MLNEIHTFKQLLDFIIESHDIETTKSNEYLSKLNELMLDCAKREFLLHQIGGLSTLIMQIQSNISENLDEKPSSLTEEAKSYIDDYTELIKELETVTNNPFL